MVILDIQHKAFFLRRIASHNVPAELRMLRNISLRPAKSIFAHLYQS